MASLSPTDENRDQAIADMDNDGASAPPVETTGSNRTSLLSSLFCYYIITGPLHEAFHIVTWLYLKNWSNWSNSNDGDDDNGQDVSVGQFLLEASLGRFVRFSASPKSQNQEEEDPSLMLMVRHAGWILSLILALLIVLVEKKGNKTNKNTFNSTSVWSSFWSVSAVRQAAIVTAIEALATDLLQIGHGTSGFGTTTTTTLLFCGNFGVILLNPKWHQDEAAKSSTVFDLLEQMIQLTFMRGAQCGGVLSWLSSGSGKDKMKGKRVRVVKGKREDLSTKLSHAVKKAVCDFSGRKNKSVQTFLGHTRFATSSLVSLEGTHPHQWTPPQNRRVYPLDNEQLWDNSNSPKPITRPMENFVCHNGDFDFFTLHGKLNSLKHIQKWLKLVTRYPVPAQVDSACIAGMIDIMRTAGCWGLSLRYAALMALPNCKMNIKDKSSHHAYEHYEACGMVFEQQLVQFCNSHKTTLNGINNDDKIKEQFTAQIITEFQKSAKSATLMSKIGFDNEGGFVDDDTDETPIKDIEAGSKDNNVALLVRETVKAFFENDLFGTLKKFMAGAVGSFGIMCSSSEDANRQICLAARGQTMSVAFYPKSGFLCFGSEQAAVKAGLNFHLPGGEMQELEGLEKGSVSQHTCRLDLDDLQGEVMLLDWSGERSDNDPMVDVSVHREGGKFPTDLRLREPGRLTYLEHNEYLLPLPMDSDRLVEKDIEDIPDALDNIQTKWKTGGLNRLTFMTFARCILNERILARKKGDIHSDSRNIDILVTGCEVSLWLAEQFAADMQRILPHLNIQAMSSNKILGIMGQELQAPAIGFPSDARVTDLHRSIVLMVSHSGGTFGTLSVAKLLQSTTQNLFVVTSEWDTQIGKQLRSMEETQADLFNSRIFTTNIGVRTAEPCSLSVAATQQLLTQILLYTCATILEHPDYIDITGIRVREQDLSYLERCNQDNIDELRSIIVPPPKGEEIMGRNYGAPALLEAGDRFANHVLENVKSYILCIIYILGTVTAGYPLISGVLTGLGYTDDSYLYAARFLDSLIYLFCPQIFIIIIRLIEGRPVLHRMTGRTVVVADIPWVSQSADAFLSKLFASSYSIAGVNVLSGNPADHLVHRHTHRVQRGTLMVAGRPDGRLSALTSSECAVNLSVSQACSIQSLGGNAEAVTIGHNPTKVGLAERDIFIETDRPQFLCERLQDVKTGGGRRSLRLKALRDRATFGDDSSVRSMDSSRSVGTSQSHGSASSFVQRIKSIVKRNGENEEGDTDTASIKAFYLEMRSSRHGAEFDLSKATEESTSSEKSSEKTESDKKKPENRPDPHSDNRTDPHYTGQYVVRDSRDVLQVLPSDEMYFGEKNYRRLEKSSEFEAVGTQDFAMELYESRIVSLQRFVAMCVMFHQMAKRVQEFFPKISFGFLGYRIDRTHSIVRVATTASPVSGDAVQERMKELWQERTMRKVAEHLLNSWRHRREEKVQALLEREKRVKDIVKYIPGMKLE